ncbi:hypothetical protein AT15_04005 [Kosmotoga arenicorallina S304]|uniref:Uncharacterized protein n=1 Tax=Kosmotoga arenicorallina S304 TaxID=1453497 RepID=A0A176JYY6_9BACT|nr:glycoside hydrolase family 9 protein [Kosmotoga arenicorallina]OAA29162.1 hypothetical protein AT15_04005 [Kosmotoga arenicorallina S304]
MKKAFLFIVVILLSSVIFSLELEVGHLEFLRSEFKIEEETAIGYWIYSNLQPDGSYKYVDAVGEGVTCVDDVARVAIFYLRQLEANPEDSFANNRAKEALSFLFKFQRTDGDFYNFVFENGTINKNGPTSRAGANWWAARAFWALSLGANVYSDIDPEFSGELAKKSKKVFNVLKSQIENNLLKGYTDMSSVMLLGACELYKSIPEKEVLETINTLAEGIFLSLDTPHGELLGLSDEGKEEFNWHGWGSRQIEALVEAYKATAKTIYLERAEKSAEKVFPLILSAGPLYSIAKSIRRFPQIAYAAEVFINSAARLYEVTGKEIYAYYTLFLGSWFNGLNILRSPMIGPNGQGYDGLEITHRNLNSGAESTISALLGLQAVKTLPEKYQKLFDEKMVLLTPAIFLEAEKLNLGLSEADIENTNIASGGALVRCKGVTALKGNLLLPEVLYRVFAVIPDHYSKEVSVSIRYGKEKVKHDLNMDYYGLYNLGLIMGTAKEERFSFGLNPSNGTVAIDTLAFIPGVIGIYFDNLDQTVIINNSNETFQGISSGNCSILPGKAIKTGETFQDKLPCQSLEIRKENGYFLLELSPLYNNNGVVDSNHRREGNFDNIEGITGASYPFEELKKAVDNGLLTLESIPFLFSDNGMDNLRTKKQCINIGFKATDLWILGSSDHGDYTGELIVKYKDGQQESFMLGLSDWCGTPRYGEKSLQLAFRYDSAGNTERISCKLYLQHFKLKGDEIETILLPDIITMHIFGITLK